MNVSSLFNVIVTLFLLLAIGYLCRRIGIVDDHSSQKLSRLIIEIGQPALIVSSFLNADSSKQNLNTGLIILGMGFVLHALFAVFALVCAKPIHDPDERKLTEFSVIFSNCSFIGFPILKALFGQIGLFYGAFYIVSFNILLWTLGLLILRRNRKDICLSLRTVILNFGTVPCAIGLGLYLSQLQLPSFVYTTVAYLADLCTPISVIITGALIATRPLKELFLSGKLYYQSFLKLIALPLLVAVLAKTVTAIFLIPNAGTWICFCTVLAALPSASTITMMAERYRIEKASYASQCVGLSSVLSLGTIPLVLLLTDWLIAL